MSSGKNYGLAANMRGFRSEPHGSASSSCIRCGKHCAVPWLQPEETICSACMTRSAYGILGLLPMVISGSVWRGCSLGAEAPRPKPRARRLASSPAWRPTPVRRRAPCPPLRGSPTRRSARPTRGADWLSPAVAEPTGRLLRARGHAVRVSPSSVTVPIFPRSNRRSRSFLVSLDPLSSAEPTCGHRADPSGGSLVSAVSFGFTEAFSRTR